MILEKLKRFFLLCIELSAMFNEIKKIMSGISHGSNDSINAEKEENAKKVEENTEKLETIKQEYESIIHSIIRSIYISAQKYSSNLSNPVIQSLIHCLN